MSGWTNIALLWEGEIPGTKRPGQLRVMFSSHHQPIELWAYTRYPYATEWRNAVFESDKVQKAAYAELIGPPEGKTVRERENELRALAVPQTWTDLEPRLDKGDANGEWLKATAFAVAGGDPEGFEIRVFEGRAIYESAMVFEGPRGGIKIRLARLTPELEQKNRWVSPDTLLEIRRPVRCKSCYDTRLGVSTGWANPLTGEPCPDCGPPYDVVR